MCIRDRPIAGCGTTKLDNSSQEQEKGDDWMEEEKKEEIKEEIKEEDKEITDSEEEEYLDVESAEDEEVDYSKYEEKKETQRQQNGTIGDVTYSCLLYTSTGRGSGKCSY